MFDDAGEQPGHDLDGTSGACASMGWSRTAVYARRGV